MQEAQEAASRKRGVSARGLLITRSRCLNMQMYISLCMHLSVSLYIYVYIHIHMHVMKSMRGGVSECDWVFAWEVLGGKRHTSVLIAITLWPNEEAPSHNRQPQKKLRHENHVEDVVSDNGPHRNGDVRVYLSNISS